MSEPILSIIIPLYNSGKIIEKVVSNILSANIDVSLLEIILIDDGSLDNTKEVCKKIFTKHKNVHYYWKENGGLASSRNYGVTKAHGKYLFFHDHDDLLVAENLYKVLSILGLYNSDLLIFESATIVNGAVKPLCVINKKFDGAVLNEKQKESIFRCLLFIPNRLQITNKIGQIWSVLVKREYVLKHQMKFVIRCDYEDDYVFILECLLKQDCLISCHKTIIYNWIIYPQSQSHALKFNPGFMDKVEKYLLYLKDAISASKFSKYANQCLSNIRWRKTRDFLLTFGRGDNIDKSYENFIHICQKNDIRNIMISRTYFKKSRNQKALTFMFCMKMYKLCFKKIVIER